MEFRLALVLPHRLRFCASTQHSSAGYSSHRGEGCGMVHDAPTCHGGGKASDPLQLDLPRPHRDQSNRSLHQGSCILGRDGTQDHARTTGTTRGYRRMRSEEHTSELQSLMRISYAVFCLKKKNKSYNN